MLDGHGEVKTFCRITCATAAAGTWLWMSGCATTLQQSSRAVTVKSLCTTSECETQPSTGLIALLSSYDHADQIKANDYRARCDEQARLGNHEIESCPPVPLISVTF
jgi:hypothetical protein